MPTAIAPFCSEEVVILCVLHVLNDLQIDLTVLLQLFTLCASAHLNSLLFIQSRFIFITLHQVWVVQGCT